MRLFAYIALVVGPLVFSTLSRAAGAVDDSGTEEAEVIAILTEFRPGGPEKTDLPLLALTIVSPRAFSGVRKDYALGDRKARAAKTEERLGALVGKAVRLRVRNPGHSTAAGTVEFTQLDVEGIRAAEPVRSGNAG